jgi:signal transduction histidine kinase
LKPAEFIVREHIQARRIHRGRLFRKYFLSILGLVCGALLISGAIGLYFSYQENKVALSSLQRDKALNAAARIEDFIRQIELQVENAAMHQLGADGADHRRLEFIKLIKLVQAVTDIAYIDANGREQLLESRLGIGTVGSGADRSAEPAFRLAREKQTWFGPVSFRKETEPYMQIAVRSRAGGPVTVADVNLKFIWDVVTRIKIGKKGKAFVVDETGHLVADPDIGLVLRKTDLSKLPHVQFALSKGADDSRALVATGLGGEEVLTAYASIAGLGWKVFVEQPVSEVYATLDAAILRTAGLLVAGLLISALVAIWLARGLVHPIRTMQESAARIGAGDLEQRIEVRSGDELEALAEQFNQMTAQLRESYAGLERKVEERTRELRRSLDHQTAISEVLRVISASPTNVQPVVEAVAERAARLCEAEFAGVLLREGEMLHATAGWSRRDGKIPIPEVPVSRTYITGRAVLDRRTVHVEDVLAVMDLEFPDARENQGRVGFRTFAAVPMIQEETAVGAISIWRDEVRPFTTEELNLLETFASQAVIAIQNVKLFREIQEKSAQLEIANKHKSDFLANMSHELRTPLNAIIGFSEVLLEKMFGEVNDKQLDYLKDIHSSGKHLLSLINDILDLSKIEAGRMELDLAEFDLPAALQNAMTLVKERAQRNGIELSVEVDPSLTAVSADERKFKQILLNLLSNAVKFTPPGGKVGVHARRLAGAVEVSVADTGIGIAPADQASVFEEFKQVGRDYTRKAEGTGLGLALTRRFVELHGGSIRLASEPGKGSTFTFTIPVQT